MSLLAGGLLELGSTLIKRLIPDKEAQAKAELELVMMQQNGELQELQTRMSAIVAEANSADPWTSRARPSFMYVFYFVIIVLTFVAPVIGVFNPDAMTSFYANVAAGFKAIPEEMWWTFTVGYLGYSGARTYEKRNGVAK
jgi:hypothetical protein